MRLCNFLSSIALLIAVAAFPMYCSAEHTHDHAIEAPHGGEILELGADEYHAELCVNEKDDIVTVYILDGAAKEEVAIAAPFLVVNLKSRGKPLQFRLAPVRPEGQTAGPTACYALQSDSLMELLHSSGTNARLAMRIGDKAYVARIAHNHTHAHEHAVQR